MAYEYGLIKIPARAPQLASFDALELATHCGVTRPAEVPNAPLKLQVPFGFGDSAATFYVDPRMGDDGNRGTDAQPFRSIHAALAAARKSPVRSTRKTIALKAGLHFLNETIALVAADSGLMLTAVPGAEGKVTISGGVELNPKWTRSTSGNRTANIWETTVPSCITEMRGLTVVSPHRRVTRAREPSADPAEGAELCTRCWHNAVKKWHSDLSCIGTATTVYKDLRDCNEQHLLPDGQPCKNDSAMWNTCGLTSTRCPIF